MSNAFSKSSFNNTMAFLDCWHWWIYPKAHATQSWMYLFFGNPYWLVWTNLRIFFCSLFANNFLITFIVQFSNEIGLKSVGCWGLCIFGTKMIKWPIDRLEINRALIDIFSESIKVICNDALAGFDEVPIKAIMARVPIWWHCRHHIINFFVSEWSNETREIHILLQQGF